MVEWSWVLKVEVAAFRWHPTLVVEENPAAGEASQQQKRKFDRINLILKLERLGWEM
jgi:hypothetical protein